MIPFLVEIYPINCTLVSEEDHTVSINLSKRRRDSLEGHIKKGESVIGKFFTSQPKFKTPAMWIFIKNKKKFEGDILLFKNNNLWHPFQNKIKSETVNRVIFSGLAYNLNTIFKDRNLLKASSGFFNIGQGCYGGRIKKI